MLWRVVTEDRAYRYSAKPDITQNSSRWYLAVLGVLEMIVSMNAGTILVTKLLLSRGLIDHRVAMELKSLMQEGRYSGSNVHRDNVREFTSWGRAVRPNTGKAKGALSLKC